MTSYISFYTGKILIPFTGQAMPEKKDRPLKRISGGSVGSVKV